MVTYSFCPNHPENLTISVRDGVMLHVNFEISKSIICAWNHSSINYYKSLTLLHYTEIESKGLIFTGEMELHDFLKESDLAGMS